MTKMTYVQALEIALATVTDEVAVERLTALKDTLVKRASAPRKPSKADLAKAEADAGLKDAIRAQLTGATASAKEVADAIGVSVQKAAALLRSMPDVVADREGKTTLFSLADADADAEGADAEGAAE